MSARSLSYTDCIGLECISSVPNLLRIFFTMKWYWTLSRTFSDYWGGHMIFVFHFVLVVYHIYWFAYVEHVLHSWNISLDHGEWFSLRYFFSVLTILLKIFYILVLQEYWSITFISVALLFDFGIRVMPTSWNQFGKCFPLQFLEEFKNWCVLFFKCLEEYSSEVVQFWAFLEWKNFYYWFKLIIGLFRFSVSS
jgi:hypothetical protein